MTRALGPRVGMPPQVQLPLTILTVCWVPLLVAGVVWVAGRTAALLTGHGWTGPPYGFEYGERLVTNGPTGVWPGTPVALVRVLTALMLLLVTVAPAVVVWRRLGRRPSPADPVPSLARPGDVAALTPSGVLGRATALRPSLRDRDSKCLPPSETGIQLGELLPRGPVLRASWEDVLVALMAPRTGKTTALAVPTILDAPGAVVATSNKADLWTATSALRSRGTGERVWVFDPQRIVHAEQTWWWNPLRGLSNVEEAHRLAGHFVQEVRGDRGDRDFWSSAAHDLLTGLLLAAALSRRSLVDVYEWLNDPVISTPVDLLRQHGQMAMASSLAGRQNGAPETRDGVYETARTAAQCLRDPQIMSWVTPPLGRLEEFPAAGFAQTRQTLYLLSKDGAGAAAPLVAALTDRVAREATRAAERRGGRLDPPLVVVLDEAANVCRIADLLDLYSHLGSRGIIPLTILQSYRQGVRVWGEPGMAALWSAATVKIVGAGLDDARMAEDISRLVGDHDVPVRSVNYGERGMSESISIRRQRILGPDNVRALPRGTALVLATGCKAAMVRLLPWYDGSSAGGVATAITESELALTTRAQATQPVLT